MLLVCWHGKIPLHISSQLARKSESNQYTHQVLTIEMEIATFALKEHMPLGGGIDLDKYNTLLCYHWIIHWSMLNIYTLECNALLWPHIVSNILVIIGLDNSLLPIEFQSQCLSLCWLIANGTLGNVLQWQLFEIQTFFFTSIAFQIVFCKMSFFCSGLFVSTHWDQVTHICVGNLAIIGSDYGLSPGRRKLSSETILENC